MPAYSFEALNLQGQLRKGVVEADTPRAARTMLRAQTLIPLRVETVDTGSLLPPAASGAPAPGMRRMFAGSAFRGPALAIWTRQLAGLVSSGLPLERALTALTEEAEDERRRHLVAALRAEVNGGSSFAAALSHHANAFPSIYVSVVAAGEATGNLGLVLQRLADDLEEAQTLRAKLVGAALYPAIVTLLAIVIVGFLVSYVVPQVASVFLGSKRALPLLTVMLLAASDFVRTWGVALLAALGLGAWMGRIALKSPPARERFDAAWLRLPLIGRLSRNFNAARFASTLAMLAGAGVPILKALHAAAGSLSNHAMRADALDALDRVREGLSLGQALSQKKRFPGLLGMFAKLGEQSGQLPVMLQRAAAQLSAEVQRRAMHLATILEPLLIVVMGAVVMVIVLAVLLPIIQLNQLVR
ncbi:MAG: type II secretion system inner membrane protein GspF [Pseudomonadota bacterium]